MSEAVLQRVELFDRSDFRRGRQAFQIMIDGFAIVAHVGVIAIGKQADGAVATWQKSLANFELHILRAGLSQVPVQRDAVGDGGHQRQHVAQ